MLNGTRDVNQLQRSHIPGYGGYIPRERQRHRDLQQLENTRGFNATMDEERDTLSTVSCYSVPSHAYSVRNARMSRGMIGPNSTGTGMNTSTQWGSSLNMSASSKQRGYARETGKAQTRFGGGMTQHAPDGRFSDSTRGGSVPSSALHISQPNSPSARSTMNRSLNGTQNVAYHIPGYGGHVQNEMWHHGKSYGSITRSVLQDRQ